MPVHATGRYFRNTILEVLKSDFGIVAYSESFEGRCLILRVDWRLMVGAFPRR
jgi:hypothetical protein